MTSLGKWQWLTIAGGAILMASLFFVNRKSPDKPTQMPAAARDSASSRLNFDSLITQAESQLTGWAKTKIASYNKALPAAGTAVQAQLYDSIAKVYDSLGLQLQADYYLEKNAALLKSASTWTRAGEGYFDIALLMNPAVKGVVLQRALNCFTQALSVDSASPDAKVGMGQCIVESGQDPMKGIGIIQGVLQKDSNNFKAQLALGEFSMESGQYPKAIGRFSKILKLSPAYIKAYLYLAEAYERTGDKKTAVACLKKYSTFATDTSLKRQVEEYIAKFESESNKQ